MNIPTTWQASPAVGRSGECDARGSEAIERRGRDIGGRGRRPLGRAALRRRRGSTRACRRAGLPAAPCTRPVARAAMRRTAPSPRLSWPGSWRGSIRRGRCCGARRATISTGPVSLPQAWRRRESCACAPGTTAAFSRPWRTRSGCRRLPPWWARSAASRSPRAAGCSSRRRAPASPPSRCGAGGCGTQAAAERAAPIAAMTRWKVSALPSRALDGRARHRRAALATGAAALPRRRSRTVDRGGMRCDGSCRSGCRAGRSSASAGPATPLRAVG